MFKTLALIGVTASILALIGDLNALNVAFLTINACLYLQACGMEAEDKAIKAMTKE